MHSWVALKTVCAPVIPGVPSAPSPPIPSTSSASRPQPHLSLLPVLAGLHDARVGVALPCVARGGGWSRRRGSLSLEAGHRGAQLRCIGYDFLLTCWNTA